MRKASSSVAHKLRTVDAQVKTSDKTWQNLETLRLPFNNACSTLVEQLELDIDNWLAENILSKRHLTGIERKFNTIHKRELSTDNIPSQNRIGSIVLFDNWSRQPVINVRKALIYHSFLKALLCTPKSLLGHDYSLCNENEITHSTIFNDGYTFWFIFLFTLLIQSLSPSWSSHMANQPSRNISFCDKDVELNATV